MRKVIFVPSVVVVEYEPTDKRPVELSVSVYDGVGKKTFKTNLVRLVAPDMRMSLFLNQGVERQGYTYMNASLLYDAANERTTISETRYGLNDFNASQDLPFNP